MVQIDTDGGQGWGECSALTEPTYTEEFAAGAFAILDEELAPRLLGHRLDAPAVLPRLSMVTGNPMAKAALEMALLDAELTATGRSLAAHLGARTTSVIAGAAVGLGLPEAVAERVAALAEEGYGRVKLKIEPGQDVEPLDAVLALGLGIEIQLDGNGSYGAEHFEHLCDIAASGVAAIEQPFPPGLVGPAANLVDRSSVPIVADEGATSLRTIGELHRARALSGVSIKPPRLGGILAAVEIHDRCLDWDLAATAGGMVETGLGRHALAATAALPGFTLTGDLSPSRRWLAADPWPDLSMVDGVIEVPSNPGVAPDPDPDLLERYSIGRIDLWA